MKLSKRGYIKLMEEPMELEKALEMASIFRGVRTPDGKQYIYVWMCGVVKHEGKWKRGTIDRLSKLPAGSYTAATHAYVSIKIVRSTGPMRYFL